MFLAPCQPALTWPVACFIIINSTEATNNKMGLGLTWILLQGYLLSSVQATGTAPCWSSQNAYLSKDAILSRVIQGMVATPHFQDQAVGSLQLLSPLKWAWYLSSGERLPFFFSVIMSLNWSWRELPSFHLLCSPKKPLKNNSPIEFKVPCVCWNNLQGT